MSTINVDVAVIGGGIAGSTISWLLQEREGLKVAVIDPRANTPGSWYPNYGEWRDEWDALSDRLQLPELRECTTTEWEITDCFFGGSRDIPVDTRTTLPRPYVRVDRIKMQELLRSRFKSHGGLSLATKLSATRIANNMFDKCLIHDKDGSLLSLDDGTNIRCKVLIDASGLESRLIAKEDSQYARGSSKEYEMGYQIAYGFIAHVDKLGPYNKDAMTLFDYRTTHLEDDPNWLKDGNDRPTFMYAMPLGTNNDGTYRIFFEETSLVGKGKRRLSFDECKKRAYKRLSLYDINVLGVEEEEYCYIPMGGELPDLTQRVIAFGGAANMVHPATGYHACRMLAASTDMAKIISNNIKNNIDPNIISCNTYKSIWSKQNRGQRDFQVYGGDFLLNQPVDKIRGFFDAFFALDIPVWGGFLAGWPGLPGNEYHETWSARLGFALSLFTKMPNDVRIAMILYSIKYTLEFGPNTLLGSLTPDFIFSTPNDPMSKPSTGIIGDEDAKEEARIMMKQFKPSANAPSKISIEVIEEVVPSPFN